MGGRSLIPTVDHHQSKVSLEEMKKKRNVLPALCNYK